MNHQEQLAFMEPAEGECIDPAYQDMIAKIKACYEYDEGQEIEDPVDRLNYYLRIAQNTEFERKVIAVRTRADKAAMRLLKEGAISV